MRSFTFLLVGVFASVLSAAWAAASDYQLVMVEQPGCAYCAAWNDQISDAYPHTAEGKFAPLVRADLHMGPPAGISYDRRVNFTPTFILVEDGAEIARMEGYVGEDFFWPLYAKLLEQHTAFVAETME
ncbi:thioredoxin fold domain-containing protein [Mameliella sediminis]|uniref:thioredoxin fold domain-containing protein n=1 Tax=Mameliella sediminis TaxID=2836866 RepID=UPI001C458F1A|nr:thioredoxin fold domain-containing protein [Mameliella sediminis]MBY6117023.1 thioredoxin family protein [Antarctobacter heliothermus]MBY6146776.1 thioredoxin family protein [Mameliella alba]MBV7396341.1 thioredoxin family protein [Mameliella sediminis]MBY6160753.1 thioredoxin family protein [Mameliella alba]MBY6169223.1 thioredoxin family protein [Mameliella alba]